MCDVVIIIVVIIVAIINRLNFHDILQWIAESISREMKKRRGGMHLIDITDNSIIAHSIVDASLLVQLKLKMDVCVDVKIDASNHASIEGLVRKAQPPVIRDLHVKAH
jgi:hypothetical protein